MIQRISAVPQKLKAAPRLDEKFISDELGDALLELQNIAGVYRTMMMTSSTDGDGPDAEAVVGLVSVTNDYLGRVMDRLDKLQEHVDREG